MIIKITIIIEVTVTAYVTDVVTVKLVSTVVTVILFRSQYFWSCCAIGIATDRLFTVRASINARLEINTTEPLNSGR